VEDIDFIIHCYEFGKIPKESDIILKQWGDYKYEVFIQKERQLENLKKVEESFLKDNILLNSLGLKSFFIPSENISLGLSDDGNGKVKKIK